jgi:radical SAM protein with 4Fe4S-binding SPASM domain
MIKLSRESLPKVTLTVITNGDYLTLDKLKELFESGLNQIKVSIYDGPAQLEYFGKMKEQGGFSDNQVNLRIRYLPDGVTDYTSIPGFFPSNRAGALKDGRQFTELKEPLKRKCYYPFYMVMLDYNGDVLLCPHDWHKKLIIGNLNESSLCEIWKSKKMLEVRRLLGNKDRNFEPCNKCNIDGTFKGEEAFGYWKDYL